jgi:hypothetical protein
VLDAADTAEHGRLDAELMATALGGDPTSVWGISASGVRVRTDAG